MEANDNQKHMIKAGIEPPTHPYNAHHIVARKAKGAEEAQDILKGWGIDIDDAANGVFLPIADGVSDAANHRTLHSDDYYKKVNNLLQDAGSKEEVIDTLQLISEQLLNGTF